MTDQEALDRAAQASLGMQVVGAARLHGGDLFEVFRVLLADGRHAVAKRGPMVDREARMLATIRLAEVSAPEVLGLLDDVLFIEHLREGPPSAPGWAALGCALRQLHSATAPSYGWDEGYAFGSVAIANDPSKDWPLFWGTRRLLAAAESLPKDIAIRVEHLAARLSELLPAMPPPVLLHGDLWGGNVLFDVDGAAWLIDPACYHGHAEVDLAMLHLFGQPAPQFYEAYGVTEPGIEDRRPIYQLWPALVHMRLFGQGYRAMVDRLLRAVGA